MTVSSSSGPKEFDGNQKVHYVCVHNKFYLERDYGMSGPRSDFVLRVFRNREEASRYAETVIEYEMEKPVNVHVDTGAIGWILSLASREGPRIRKQEGENLRVDISRMPQDEHPRTNSILYRYDGKRRYYN